MGIIWARIGRGCPPSTPGHFWIIFGKTHFSSNNSKNIRKIMKRPRAGKPVFFSEKSYKSKRRASPQLEFWRPDDIPIFHMEPIREKTCFGKKTSILVAIAVHAQDSCACTRILCMHRCCLNYSINRVSKPK